MTMMKIQITAALLGFIVSFSSLFSCHSFTVLVHCHGSYSVVYGGTRQCKSSKTF